MPRRYHRPPSTKRRKPKKTTIPYAFEAEPEPAGVEAPVAAPALEAEELEEPALEPAVVTRPSGEKRPSEAGVRHITRDYRYVRSEVIRIVLVAGLLLTCLVIAAVVWR